MLESCWYSDAVNETDTAHTLLGRKQCDEDDYGYLSFLKLFYSIKQDTYIACVGRLQVMDDSNIGRQIHCFIFDRRRATFIGINLCFFHTTATDKHGILFIYFL